MTLGVAKDAHSELKFKIFQQETVCLQIQAKIPGFVEWKWCKLGALAEFSFESSAPATGIRLISKKQFSEDSFCPSLSPPVFFREMTRWSTPGGTPNSSRALPSRWEAVATYAKPNAASLWAGGGHVNLAVFLSGGSHQHFGQHNALSYWTVPHHGAFTIHNYIPPNASHSYCCEKPDTPQAFPNTH